MYGIIYVLFGLWVKFMEFVVFICFNLKIGICWSYGIYNGIRKGREL